MRAEGFLRESIYNTLSWMHQTRLEALCSTALSALGGANLTVTDLGRCLDGSDKHGIKRVDRLLSNRELQKELARIYSSIIRPLLQSIKRPVISIDWSDIDEGQKFFLLRATFPLKGRTVTVYEEVHGIETKERRETHSKFLKRLKEILPEHCEPIIITDAGFRGPWFRAVQALGWDYIGRVRNHELIELEGSECWQSIKQLYPFAGQTPRNLGPALLTKTNPLPCNIFLYKAKPKGRVNKTKSGKKARSKKSKRNASSQKDPWLLATSIAGKAAKKIIKTYALRMQIEESFRDLKSSRFGFGLENSGTKSVGRLSILALIGSLVALFAYIVGLAAYSMNIHRKFQVNTKPRGLSFVFIGLRIIRTQFAELTRDLFHNAIALLTQFIRSHVII